MKSRKEIKKTARELLARNLFSNEWLMMLLAILLMSLISGAVSSFVIGFILVGCFSIGLARIQLAVVRRQDKAADLGKMFTGFTDGHVGDNIVLGILQTIFIFLWSLLFIIPGIVKSYSYAMSYFIKIDHPELSASDCITASRKMMKGHKFDLFYLHLSFIGWFLLSIFTFGIGLLWLCPYVDVATAAFYNDLKAEQGELAVND